MYPFKFHGLFYLSDRSLEMTLLLVVFSPCYTARYILTEHMYFKAEETMVKVQHETEISYFKIRKCHEYFCLSTCVPMLVLDYSTAASFAGLSLLEHSEQTLLKGCFGHVVETFPCGLVWSLAPGVKWHLNNP